VGTISYLRLVRTPVDAIIFQIPPPEKTQFNFELMTGGPPALSPDGRTVAFLARDASGKQLLWLRSFDSLAAQPLAGTEGAVFPFWSANGRKVGFFADRKLKTLDVSGGPVRELANAPFPGGGSWNREGTLLFSPDFFKGVYQVTGSDSTPVPVFKLDPSKYSNCAWPKFLPDGKHFLYQAWAFDPASNGTYFASLDGRENRLLLKGESRTTYAAGYLLYLLDKTLMAQAFDPERGQVKGDAHPVAAAILDDLQHSSLDASENGVLVYQAGDSQDPKRIAWFDRSGKALNVSEEGNYYQEVRLSPDGAKLAFKVGEPTTDILVDELARGVRIRITKDTGSDYTAPTWSPDGRRILFGGGMAEARPGIYQMNSNGAGSKELVLAAQTSEMGIWPTSWSPDGKFILFVLAIPPDPMQHQEIWVLPLTGDRKPRLFVQKAFDGQFSPDGRWVSYSSMEPGKLHICVVPFNGTKVLDTDPGAVTSLTGKYQISASFGALARWRRDGREIFYIGGKGMTAAEVDGRGDSFEARKEQALFKLPGGSGHWDVTPDGKRFVMITQKVSNAPLTLVVNWTARLGKQ
jgi:Tol biopolymer transport system component